MGRCLGHKGGYSLNRLVSSIGGEVNAVFCLFVHLF